MTDYKVQAESFRARLHEMTLERDELKEKISNKKLELRAVNEHNRRRNLELDALHYVWCDGGCYGGVHRWQKENLTREIVKEAVRNTARLVTWWNNHYEEPEDYKTNNRLCWKKPDEIVEWCREHEATIKRLNERQITLYDERNKAQAERDRLRELLDSTSQQLKRTQRNRDALIEDARCAHENAVAIRHQRNVYRTECARLHQDRHEWKRKWAFCVRVKNEHVREKIELAEKLLAIEKETPCP
jgi:hypothetical protein